MGMITRVRGRLHSITKIDPQVKEEKIAETVCLLSVLFLLPYCGRGHAPLLLGLGGMWLAMYSCLVLPLLISANYKYPARWLRRLREHLPGMFLPVAKYTLYIIKVILQPMNKIENKYLQMASINVIINQLLFFTMCDKALCKHDQKKLIALVALNTLLLYYVITYFVQRIIDITSNVKSNTTSNSSLMLCILKIILEWCKAIVVIICLKEQGLKPHPHLVYSIVTCLYYLTTEPVYKQVFNTLLNYLHFEYFEGIEEIYAAVILHSLAISFSVILIPVVLFHHKHFSLIIIYQLIYLQTKSLYCTYWKQLSEARRVLSSFVIATGEDLQAWNDVCAVCLGNMKCARRTSCGHLFHAECLRRCIQASEYCPLCKTNIFTI